MPEDRAGHPRKRGPSVPGPANVASSSGNHMQSLGTITSRNNAAGMSLLAHIHPSLQLAHCALVMPSIDDAPKLPWRRTHAYFTGLKLLLPPCRRHAVPRRSTKQQGCPGKAAASAASAAPATTAAASAGATSSASKAAESAPADSSHAPLSAHCSRAGHSIQQPASHTSGACSVRPLVPVRQSRSQRPGQKDGGHKARPGRQLLPRLGRAVKVGRAAKSAPPAPQGTGSQQPHRHHQQPGAPSSNDRGPVPMHKQNGQYQVRML